MNTPFYKVLGADGRSFHGGDMAYSLPTRAGGGAWTAGDWHEVTGDLELCYNGLHLTSDPAAWWAVGARLFAAEYDGEAIGDGGDKIAVRRCRLLRELVGADLHALRIFAAGNHAVGEGRAWAYGSATVEASGSATVEAYGSATVRASGSATVRASGSATVEAYGSATVEAYGSATVRAYGSATVEAYGSATVRASGSATVRAYDSATVRAYGSATVRASGSATVRAYDSATVNTTQWGQPTVAVAGYAVWIDRKNGVPVIHAVTGAEFREVIA